MIILEKFETFEINRETNSFQFSIYNLQEYKIVTQPIYEELYEEINLKEIQLFETFYQDLIKGKELNEDEVLKKEIKNYFNLKPFEYLKDNLNEGEFKYHFYVCIYYLYEKVLKKEKNCILPVINKLNEYFKQLENDKIIELYNKILILKTITISLKDKLRNSNDKIQTIKDFNLKYYNKEKINEIKVYKIAIDFLKQFSNELTGKSKLFYPLLLLDSGIGYYNKQLTYCFNNYSPEMIKEHLKKCIPEVFLTEKSSNEKNASIFVKTGIIILNERFIFNSNNIDNEEEENKYIDNIIKESNKDETLAYNISVRIIKHFLHETNGRYKFKLETINDSPRKFFDSKGELKSFENIEENNEKKFKIKKCYKSEKELKILKFNSKKGESGRLLEYFIDLNYFGDISNSLVKVKDLYKIIMDIKLWVGDLRELQIYVNLKKKMQKKKLYIVNWKEMTIKEEIKEMRKQLKNYLKSLNFNFLGNKIRNENFFSPKKKSESEESLFNLSSTDSDIIDEYYHQKELFERKKEIEELESNKKIQNKSDENSDNSSECFY